MYEINPHISVVFINLVFTGALVWPGHVLKKVNKQNPTNTLNKNAITNYVQG